MAEKIPPEVQQHVVRYQQVQAQLNQLIAEKSVLEQELREINRALEVLKSVPGDAEIYRATGHLLVKINKESAEKELNERKELIELRIKTLTRQEALLRQQLSEIQNKLSEYLPSTHKKSS